MKRDKNLLQLARLFGVQTSYLDMTKQRRDADPEALFAVLRAMGAGVMTMADVPEALARRKDELHKRKIEPVLVAWDGKLGNRRLELGYHDIEINGQPAFVISAPSVSAGFSRGVGRSGKTWGVFAPIYALHSKRNPDAGDLTDFENLMDWMHGLGGRVAATLPLLGAFLDEPFEPSPYSPATRLFWNEFYIDIERIPEFAGHKGVEPVKRTKYIDYRGVMAKKRQILEDLSREFFAGTVPDRQRAFHKFVRAEKGVEDYARFRAVTDRQRKPWISWPARLRDGTLRSSDYDEAVKDYYLYSQWIVQQQLEGLSQRAATRGQLLYLDLPLGLHSGSYDVWRNRDLFVEGAAGGAPPDPVFTKGQNWGFPPMNPQAIRRNRYQYVIAYLRNHFRYAKLLRLDHVMGLHRLYWIPNDFTGDKGVYVEYPAEELWAILCLESHRHQAAIVGENLGTVPPAVNSAMKRHHILGMYVVQYEIMGNPAQPKLRPPPANCVASLNTHDMPPFRAFLDGIDIDDRLDLGLLRAKTAQAEHKQRAKMIRALRAIGAGFRRVPAKAGTCSGILQFLSSSMANIVLINLEDLWEETLPQNVPATGTERPNWLRRVRPSIEQIRKMAGIAKVLSNVFAQRSRHLSV